MRSNRTMANMLRVFVMIAGGAVLGGMAGACDDTPAAGGGNSESHFLQVCHQTCGGGLECICGVCTRACDETSECRSLSEVAVCMDTCEGASASQACDVPCSGGS